MTTSGDITGFPAPGLRDPFRYVTGHDGSGNSIFVQTDHGDHRAIMVEGAAAQAIFYSTGENPVEVNGNTDMEFVKTRPSLHIPNGCVVRMIDFAPGVESNLHRALCIGIGTVCEGEMELSLDSGEKRIMHPGDVSVNRGAMHRWRNVSKDKPARMLYVLLDVKPIIVNGKALEFDLGYLEHEYADYEGAEDGTEKVNET
ncbi:hypothetical protein BKA67DRAFT_515779 [Truncatella angustata]|uniref:Cupin type-2 domain-containing protein n=1 Tax=Truncatella angustata TaxID=152316 RepID=A0A9P9A0D6_9PEZI|nr:uncharacterized protein BKA67DRAFT_515779 [Truncatella angustata]KAH6656005.1 hypothetical protein BKA67DRAFT_515779 [Truncatella angustata]